MIREIDDQREVIDSLCRRFRVRRLELFGSAAAGGFNPGSSDLDFLVSFDDLRPSEYAEGKGKTIKDAETDRNRKNEQVVMQTFNETSQLQKNYDNAPALNQSAPHSKSDRPRVLVDKVETSWWF